MARHREPGTPPRPLVVLAGLGLAAVTGLAIWFLPAQATPDWSAPGPSHAARVSAAPSPSPAPSAAEPVPSGFVAFVDTARTPRLDLAQALRRTGVRWFSLGRLMAGPGGCEPTWAGGLAPGRTPLRGPRRRPARRGRSGPDCCSAGPTAGRRPPPAPTRRR
ncbi:hypothetical protein GCM10020219_098600 [Nonomuraea dietziae]